MQGGFTNKTCIDITDTHRNDHVFLSVVRSLKQPAVTIHIKSVFLERKLLGQETSG